MKDTKIGPSIEKRVFETNLKIQLRIRFAFAFILKIGNFANNDKIANKQYSNFCLKDMYFFDFSFFVSSTNKDDIFCRSKAHNLFLRHGKMVHAWTN